jgi:probable rRNA maturation factor
MKLNVDIQQACGGVDLPSPVAIRQWVKAALGNRRQATELTVRIVSTAEISQLNSDYRHKTGPTNVLSFPADLPAGIDVPLLGDLVICAEVVAREADEQHKPLHAHWAHMVVHGTLHLLGYDHIDDADADIMENLEIDILKRINIPNPYTPMQSSLEGRT